MNQWSKFLIIGTLAAIQGVARGNEENKAQNQCSVSTTAPREVTIHGAQTERAFLVKLGEPDARLARIPTTQVKDQDRAN